MSVLYKATMTRAVRDDGRVGRVRHKQEWSSRFVAAAHTLRSTANPARQPAIACWQVPSMYTACRKLPATQTQRTCMAARSAWGRPSAASLAR